MIAVGWKVSGPESFLITVKSKPFHGILYAAKKKAGSMKRLAESLGVCLVTLYRWTSLRDYPRSLFGHSRRGPRWDRDAFDILLMSFTGAGIDELWPSEIRTFIDRTRDVESFEFERSHEVPLIRLTSSVERQLAIEDHSGEFVIDYEASLEAITQALSNLSEREREVLKLRYGLCGCEPHTQAEVSRMFHVTTMRIGQIEAKAIQRLQRPGNAAILVEFNPD
jgi:RNA polymerase sigma factor (sigma-70 family)